MSVHNALNTALFSKLAGGTALISALGGTAIYYAQAPDGAALPFLIFSNQAGGPTNDTPLDTRDQIVFVRAYAAAPLQAGSIDALASALLHRNSISVSGYTNYWTSRETELSTVENPPDGQRTYMAGALYRVRLGAT
jgi:hypothetical protein